MDLSTFAIVFVFASEFFLVETIKDFCNGFGWFGQHRFERHTRLEFAVLMKIGKTVLDNSRYDNFVAG